MLPGYLASTSQATKNLFALCLCRVAGAVLVYLLLIVSGCTDSSGRVAVILDNSGSMASVGVAFVEIKQMLLNTLVLMASSHEIGLRVFGDGGSKLLVPYQRNLDALRTALAAIEPRAGTYIGQSLLDAAEDLRVMPRGNHRLLLMTDGEGDTNDITLAAKAKERLQALQGDFKCYFIIFSTRPNPQEETPIGKIANALGCDFAAPDVRGSALPLAMALQRIVGIGFDIVWLILSALAYITLLLLTANLVFHTQFAQSVLPRNARWIAVVFFFIMLPLIISVHFIGLLGWSAEYGWLAIVAVLLLVVGPLIAGKRRDRPRPQGIPDDPFA